jgi:hypothetical protein
VTTPQPKDVVKISDAENEFLALMEGCNYHGHSFRQHEIAGEFLFKNDPKTIALELPLWLSPDKTPNQKPWGGSVDVVRVVGQRIQICDFKPSAMRVNKKQVGAQLYRYGFMLHHLTGIPLEDIDLIYFDEKVSFKIII